MNSIIKFSFNYILPFTLGTSMGFIYRDMITINVDKKLSMSLADYYKDINDEVDGSVKKQLPEVESLLKKSTEGNDN